MRENPDPTATPRIFFFAGELAPLRRRTRVRDSALSASAIEATKSPPLNR
jgi:hypothetical protein